MLRLSAFFGWKPLQRSSSVFSRNLLDSDRLWIGVTGAPGQKKKRARGKRRVTRPKIDLNRGQRIGMNSENLVIPVLQGSLTDSSGFIKKISSGQLHSEEYEAKLQEMRIQQNKKRSRMRLPPLLRGWSGNQMGGQRLDPPGVDYQFKGFESRIVEFKMVSHMTATFGRYPSFSVMVVTGNKQGLAGYAVGRSPNRQAAMRKANSKATQRLEFFDLRDDGRTLWHSAFAQVARTKVFAIPQPSGQGLRCHRLIREVCRVLGIEDLYAKVEGSVNYQAIMKAFFLILRQQETFQDLANRENLHVVEMCEDSGSLPVVMASPSNGVVREIYENEKINYNLDSYYMNGRVTYLKHQSAPAYLNNPGQVRSSWLKQKFRNQEVAFRERCMMSDIQPNVILSRHCYQPGMLGLYQSYHHITQHQDQ